MWRSIIVALLVICGLETFADEPKPAEKPQYERLLQGDDAKKAAELEKKIEEAEQADQYNVMVRIAEELLALRSERQGRDHWQTVTQKWVVDRIRKLDALPKKNRASWISAYQRAFEAAELESKAQYTKAESIWQEFRCQSEDTLGEKHPDTAGSYFSLAKNKTAQGNYADANPLFQKALELNRELLGEKHPYTAECIGFLGRNLSDLGKYADARLLVEKTLDLNREVLGEANPSTAQSYGDLAVILDLLGNHAIAQPLHRKALELNRRLNIEKNFETAVRYGNLARNMDYQGKYADAQPLFRIALNLCRELEGEKGVQTARNYEFVASNLSSQLKHAEAKELYQKALDIRLELLHEKHPAVLSSYNNLAVSLNNLERYADAQPILEKALNTRREFFHATHPSVLDSYNNLAANLHSQQKYAEARPLFRHALEMYREVVGEKHFRTGASYINLACSFHAQGMYDEALPLLTRAATTYEATRLSTAMRGMDRSVHGLTLSPYPLMASVEAHLRSEPAAWIAAEADLSRGMSDEIASRRVTSLTVNEERQRAILSDRLNQLQPLITQLIIKQDATDSEMDQLNTLKAERRTLDAQLAEMAVTLSKRELAALWQVQHAIPDDASVIMWIDVSRRGIQEHWACVVSRTGGPKWARIPGTGPRDEWTKQDTELPMRMRDALASDTFAKFDQSVLAKRLFAQRLAPIAKHLDGVKTLYVVAVNEMAGIPVEVLTQDYTISYIPSGTFLARLKEKPRPRTIGLLALGDPNFTDADAKPMSTDLPPGGLLIKKVVPEGTADKANLGPGDVIVRYGEIELTTNDSLMTAIKAAEGSSSSASKSASQIPMIVWREGEVELINLSVSPGRLGVVLDPLPAREAIANRRKTDEMLLALRGGDWKELPATGAEVTQLGKLFGPAARTLLDSAASEQSLDEIRMSGELSKYRYLHFATHGEANNVRAFESTLIMSQDMLPKDPLPRAGEPFINGQLSANEVLEFWNLDAELVTLSACETAVGRDGGGDGLLGFAQAFLTAGSRAVCLSLWKVDDTATALMMTRFYQNLLGKRPGLDAPMAKAAALHEAKRWLRELSETEAERLIAESTKGFVRGDRGGKAKVKIVDPPKDPVWDGSKPYAHPRYWSAFILIGDPN